MVGQVLSLCDFTGIMVKPWIEAGYEATIVDCQHPGGATSDGLLSRLGCDIMDLDEIGDQWDMVFAFPPCTHLAVSGARWFRDKGLKGLIEGLTLVEQCRKLCEQAKAPWMIENPVSTLATYWRKPNHMFNPCDFGGYLDPPGDAYTKKTCLWTGGGFVWPLPRPVDPIEGSKMHLMGPSPDRANLRSATPEGFARAVFAANAKVQACQ